jgi:hypothetical protein
MSPQQRPDPDIVEAIVDVISQAIEYRLGYRNNYEATHHYTQAPVVEYERGKYAHFQLQGEYEMVTYEKEHAIARLVNWYNTKGG